jgi:hypothetical protein
MSVWMEYAGLDGIAGSDNRQTRKGLHDHDIADYLRELQSNVSMSMRLKQRASWRLSENYRCFAHAAIVSC